ncbi:peptidase M14 [bacterium]|nr:peptidase M14 [bacterium]
MSSSSSTTRISSSDMIAISSTTRWSTGSGGSRRPGARLAPVYEEIAGLMLAFCQRRVNRIMRQVLRDRPGAGRIAALLTLTMVVPVLADPLTTPWERDPEATPRHAETVAWCERLAAASPTVTATVFGTSPEGRELPLVIWDPDGLSTPAAAHAADRVILLVQGCIHAGESCGKDAGMTLLRDLVARGGPEGVTLLFIPIFNVDGHERFGPHNRINQNGPREMGWRVTAQNLNLNRDFAKADAPEMRAWLGLWNAWKPHVLIDTHSTNGADYQYPITYGLELHGSLDAALTGWLEGYRDVLTGGLADRGFPVGPYVQFVRWHDPRSGLRSFLGGPRFSQGYAAVRNRPGILVEAHMLKPYPVRVAATRALLDVTLDHVASRAAELRRLTAEADARSASAAFRADSLTLRWNRGERSRPFEFLGVQYEAVTSEISGGDYFRYHADRPDTFLVDYHDAPEPAVRVPVPEAYLVPPAWTGVIARLEAHGVRMTRLTRPRELEVRGWRLRDCSWNQTPYEGRHRLDFAAQERRERRRFPAGTAVVDLAQPAARLIVHLLDPAGPDALLRWGFFDAQLTRVEYVESYVIEAMMPGMIAADPALADSLAARKARDPAFAGDPWAIRRWFYERTPYHDDRAWVYPVAAIDDRSALDFLR